MNTGGSTSLANMNRSSSKQTSATKLKGKPYLTITLNVQEDSRLALSKLRNTGIHKEMLKRCATTQDEPVAVQTTAVVVPLLN